MVTHGVSWLHEADHIVVLKDGDFSEGGTYEQLMKQSGAFAEFMQQHRVERIEDDDE